MKILITGADGFVGAALCNRLRNEAVPLCGVVRRLKSTLDGDRFVEVGDISASTDWSPALQDVTEVVHLAARVHFMNESSPDPLAEFRRVNVEGTVNLARQAAAHGVSRFVFLSSIKVNGELTGAGQPFTATDAPSPEDPYGVSKCKAEQKLWQIATETGMEVVVLRPPLVYGPGVKGNFIRLMQLIDKQVPLPLGAIQNQRSLIYLDNLVDAIRVCLTHPKAAGKTFLVSDEDDVSTPGLIRRIAAAMGRRPLLLPVPVSLMKWASAFFGKKAAVDRLLGSLCVDMTPLREELGWNPPYTMQAGLETTAQWYLKTKVSA
jgi:nucleoside-diphosphate-sugar epimerase